MSAINLFSKGFIIGVANIIPGVSGGTLALVLGLYERLLGAINSISFSTAMAFSGLFRFNSESRERFKQEMKKIDIFFLIPLGIGAVAAIVSLAKFMTWLLLEWHDPTYGFFFGLVFFSISTPFLLIKKRSLRVFVLALIGITLVVSLSMFNGEATKEKANNKNVYATEEIQQSTTHKPAERGLSVARGVFFFVSGAVSISAMVLPGISGSFILLLMGGYFDILRAITERNWLILILFCSGCAVGLLLFTRLLEFLLKKFYDETLGFLTGLVIGSLWAIWPFKSWELAGGEKIYLDNIFPAQFGQNEILTFIAFLAGAFLIMLFLRLEKKTDSKSLAKV